MIVSAVYKHFAKLLLLDLFALNCIFVDRDLGRLNQLGPLAPELGQLDQLQYMFALLILLLCFGPENFSYPLYCTCQWTRYQYHWPLKFWIIVKFSGTASVDQSHQSSVAWRTWSAWTCPATASQELYPQPSGTPSPWSSCESGNTMVSFVSCHWFCSCVNVSSTLSAGVWITIAWRGRSQGSLLGCPILELCEYYLREMCGCILLFTTIVAVAANPVQPCLNILLLLLCFCRDFSNNDLCGAIPTDGAFQNIPRSR